MNKTQWQVAKYLDSSLRNIKREYRVKQFSMNLDINGMLVSSLHDGKPKISENNTMEAMDHTMESL